MAATLVQRTSGIRAAVPLTVRPGECRQSGAPRRCDVPRSGHRRVVAGSVDGMVTSSPVVVVTGANGLVGAAVCRALVERSAQVRAVVRRTGSAPALDGVTEHVGDFADEGLARAVTQGADAVVTTVHPMGSSREVQHRVGVEGTPVLARAARDAGVARLVHVSTAGVYDRSAGVGDVAEDGALLPEGSGDYPDTKNAVDAALAQVGVDRFQGVDDRADFLSGEHVERLHVRKRHERFRDLLSARSEHAPVCRVDAVAQGARVAARSRCERRRVAVPVHGLIVPGAPD